MNLYDNTGLYISYQEYNPADPATPGPSGKGKILGQGVEYQIETVTNTESVPSVTTSHSGGGSSTTAAHTITKTNKLLKALTVFYVYGEDGVVKKTLPEHIQILIFKHM